MKELFSISMFKEHLRKLRLPALVLTFLATFGIIMELIIVVLMGYGKDPDWIIPSVWQVYVTPVVAMILSGILIHDYRTRNGSDFYHSLPVSRRSVVLSATFAVMCWGVVYMVLPVLIQSILKFVFMLNTLDLGRFMDVFFFGLIVSFYLNGALWLAHALTGTRMSHIAVTILILAGPRALLYVVGLIIENTMPYLILRRFDFLFAPQKYNYVLSSMSTTGASVTSVVYTLLLSIIYYALALWLIKKRPSESAGHPTWTSRMETSVRVLLACALSLPAILGMLMIYFISGGYGSYTDTSYTEFMLLAIIFYSLAVIVYFLYEILQTKKIKNSFKHWKGLGWVALFNVIIIVGVIILHKSVINKQPAPDDIVSVSIMDLRDEADANWKEDVGFDHPKLSPDKKNGDAYQELIFDIPLTSENMRKAVSEELKKAITEGNDYTYHNGYLRTENLQINKKYNARVSGTDVLVNDSVYQLFEPSYRTGLKITLKNGKTIYRRLTLPAETFAEIIETPEFLERVEQIDLLKMIEGYKEFSTFHFSYFLGGGTGDFDQWKKINALEADIKAMDAKQKRDFLFHSTIMFPKGEVVGYYDEWIYVELCSDYEYESQYKIPFVISPEICPSFYPYAEAVVIQVNIRQKLIDGTYEGGDVSVSN
ncbi:MAG: hypothetical protein J5757_07130 [Lachnospiraceae bacterium]|nr:hypothetical protein [Lachnospiraceae bacterium]